MTCPRRGLSQGDKADAAIADLVGIFGVDVVLDGDHAMLGEVLGRNLYQIRNLGLATPPGRVSGCRDDEGRRATIDVRG